MAFFLDDGTVAGDAAAVKHFVTVFQEEMAACRLTLATAKCEVVPEAGEHTTVGRESFQGWL